MHDFGKEGYNGVQEEVVEYVASTIYDLMTSGDGKRRLFLIQTYLIGKEKILMEVTTLKDNS